MTTKYAQQTPKQVIATLASTTYCNLGIVALQRAVYDEFGAFNLAQVRFKFNVNRFINAIPMNRNADTIYPVCATASGKPNIPAPTMVLHRLNIDEGIDACFCVNIDNLPLVGMIS